MVNVGKYIIHGSYGYLCQSKGFHCQTNEPSSSVAEQGLQGFERPCDFFGNTAFTVNLGYRGDIVRHTLCHVLKRVKSGSYQIHFRRIGKMFPQNLGHDISDQKKQQPTGFKIHPGFFRANWKLSIYSNKKHGTSPTSQLAGHHLLMGRSCANHGTRTFQSKGACRRPSGDPRNAMVFVPVSGDDLTKASPWID